METTERPRTAYHHGNLRAALLERAEEMLDVMGPHDLSLRELARSVGVSHGAPRRHFPDRQALLDALSEAGFERLGAELDSATAGLPQAPAAGGVVDEEAFVRHLSVFAHAWVRFAVRHAALLELMFAPRDRPGAARLRAAAEQSVGPSARFLAAAAEGAQTTVLAALQGLAALIGSGMTGERPARELIDDTVRTLARGLLPR